MAGVILSLSLMNVAVGNENKIAESNLNTYITITLNTYGMSTKLTLTVDKFIIEEAKKYAKSNGRSLSNIIEEYLKSLIEYNTTSIADLDDFEISPIVQALWGSVKPISDSINYKELLGEELAKKYLK